MKNRSSNRWVATVPLAVACVAATWLAGACGKKPAAAEAGAQADGALTANPDAPADGDPPGPDARQTAQGREPQPPTPPRCVAYAEPKATGVVADEDLVELSGLAASVQHPGVLWAHNDGGHKPRLYAIDAKGSKLATFKMKDVPEADWEAIGLGPCSHEAVLAGTPCLYVADTGDNLLARKVSHVLRMAEPTKIPAPGEDRSIGVDAAQVEAFAFTFPDGPQDVEAMAVLPDTRVLLLSKRDDGLSYVYRLTLQPGAVAQAERLGTLSVRDPPLVKGLSLRVTAADLTADGRYLLVRAYFRLFLFDLGAALSGPAAQAEAALAAATPTRLKLGQETQGEAVAWNPAGGYWHVAEGAGATLYSVACAP